MPTSADQTLIDAAFEQAQKSYDEGGLPIGSVLATADGEIVARGHNLRVQTGDPTAHAEVVCIRNAGRRRDWPTLTLASTLSPCIMCTGTGLLYRIPRVVVGENQNYLGAERPLPRARRRAHRARRPPLHRTHGPLCPRKARPLE